MNYFWLLIFLSILDLFDVLPPCTLLDIDESGSTSSSDYNGDVDLRSDDGSRKFSRIRKRKTRQHTRAKRQEKRIPGVTCRLLPPCITTDNIDDDDVTAAQLSVDRLNNQQPGIDCTYDYSIYDYGSFEYLDYPNEDRSLDGNSENILDVEASIGSKQNDTTKNKKPVVILDPPPLTTSTTTSKPLTGVASSDLLPIEESKDKSHNIVMNCLKMLLKGEEPLEGVNCINKALTDEFESFNFTSVVPGKLVKMSI